MTNFSIFKLWGKASKNNSGNISFHPLAYHMLDVAAVADEWIKRNPFILKFLNLNENNKFILIIAAALHDIGKASVYFQNKIPELAKQNDLFWDLASKTSGFDHGAFACHWIDYWKDIDSGYKELIDKYKFFSNESFLDLCKHACWHHGKPYTPTDYKYLDIKDNNPKDKDVFYTIIELRRITIDFVIQSIIGNQRNLNFKCKLTPSQLRYSAGFFSVCDWIGSNKDFFPYFIHEVSDYYSCSKEYAKKALDKIGFKYNSKIQIKSIDKILDQGKQPRPIQSALEGIECQSPSLIIIEAPTGEGKTESAFFLFARNPGNGFFIALPSQASANQMSNRIQKMMKEKLNIEEEVILAHSNAWLTSLISNTESYGNNNNPELDTKAESEFSDWFHSKKRTLLAKYGVGTVDQAIMAALNIKHGFVKLFGLSGKTLIIDEVHAYDAFMLPIIQHLLLWCRYLNINVVLLSATLPLKMKIDLIQAYLDLDEDDKKLIYNNSYPMITVAAKDENEIRIQQIDSYNEIKIGTRKKENICFSFHSHSDRSIFPFAEKKVLDKIKDGGNILWICNTINKAQFVYSELTNYIKQNNLNIELYLFHSRFTKKDRLEIEKHIESLYGEESKSQNRPQKSVLVATQVVEQSLDIDLDLLVTDIAPIDLILQRAGRIFRHNRNNRSKNILSPEILILIPNELEKLDDFSSVYDRFTICKTLYKLCSIQNRTIQLPCHYRDLVDSVYSDEIPKEELLKLDNIQIQIQKSEWEKFLDFKKDNIVKKNYNGRQQLIPLPSSDILIDAALLSENEYQYWSAKTRDGNEKMNFIIIKNENGNFTLDGFPIPKDIPDEIPISLTKELAMNTVEVSHKELLNLSKNQRYLVDDKILICWQDKLEKIRTFKGSKLVAFENGHAKINSQITLSYDNKYGMRIE